MTKEKWAGMSIGKRMAVLHRAGYSSRESLGLVKKDEHPKEPPKKDLQATQQV